MEQTVIPTGEGAMDSASYGKFKSAEELLKAYNSLEQEFTKRSQRLKEMEKKSEKSEAWEKKVNTFIEKYPIASELTEELGKVIAEKNNFEEENCLESALLSVLTQKYKSPAEQAKDEKVIQEILNNSDVKEKIISDYKKNFDITLPKPLPKGGEIPVNPPVRPATIYEAGKAALELLKEI